MSKEDVFPSHCEPGYQYTIDSEETRVHDDKEPKIKLAKSTALNMIPIAGPLISLPGQISPKPTAAETEIKFGTNGKASVKASVNHAALLPFGRGGRLSFFV